MLLANDSLTLRCLSLLLYCAVLAGVLLFRCVHTSQCVKQLLQLPCEFSLPHIPLPSPTPYPLLSIPRHETTCSPSESLTTPTPHLTPPLVHTSLHPTPHLTPPLVHTSLYPTPHLTPPPAHTSLHPRPHLTPPQPTPHYTPTPHSIPPHTSFHHHLTPHSAPPTSHSTPSHTSLHPISHLTPPHPPPHSTPPHTSLHTHTLVHRAWSAHLPPQCVPPSPTSSLRCTHALVRESHSRRRKQSLTCKLFPHWKVSRSICCSCPWMECPTVSHLPLMVLQSILAMPLCRK